MTPAWDQEEWFAVPRHWARLERRLVSYIYHNLLGPYYGTTGKADSEGWFRPRDLQYGEKLRNLGVIEAKEDQIRLTHRSPLRIRKFPARPRHDESSYANHDLSDVAGWVHHCLKQVGVGWAPPETLPTSDESLYSLAQTQFCLRKVRASLFGLKIGQQSRRFYHTLCAKGSRGARKHITWEGTSMADLDIHCAFPSILGGVVAEEEREDYMNLILEGDIYSDLGPSLHRDLAKEQMMKLFGGYLYLDLALHQGFVRRYPQTARRFLDIKTSGGSLQATLQNLESQIMLSGVGRKCLQSHTPFISLHDGGLFRKEDAEKVQGWVIECFTEAVGFAPRVTFKNPRSGIYKRL